MTTPIGQILSFFYELDALKGVERRSYIQHGQRPENSAEHSWHLAMACWALAEALQLDVDINKLIKLALVHDLGEIGAGDTFLYSPDRADAHIKERACVAELADHPGNSISNLLALWEEQESGNSPETRLLKVIDRILPLQLNMQSDGIAWLENKVHKDQVLQMNGFIADEFPPLWEWVQAQVAHAVAQGWLRDD
ncbi:HD domain-containing protein [Granulosicoccaceae sp. 1_MG-2023]|nr:HD domain-containing protein [Granulosicoccaceae sp. 1_MG-2023]